jgi:hypothetical protein
MVDIAQRERTIFPDAREDYIYETNIPNSMTNYLDRHNQQQETWENLEGPGHKILGPASPWNPFGGTVGPDAYPEINENWIPGVNNYLKPSWMDAGITNRNLGGYKVMNAEEQGGGIFNYPFTDNPLTDELFRRHDRNESLKERRRRDKRNFEKESPYTWGDQELSEGESNFILNLLLQEFERKQSQEPGTGNLSPIFGWEPYWNI